MSETSAPQYLGLGLNLTAAQEQFSKAFIMATASYVAAVIDPFSPRAAGCR